MQYFFSFCLCLRIDFSNGFIFPCVYPLSRAVCLTMSISLFPVSSDKGSLCNHCTQHLYAAVLCSFGWLDCAYIVVLVAVGLWNMPSSNRSAYLIMVRSR